MAKRKEFGKTPEFTSADLDSGTVDREINEDTSAAIKDLKEEVLLIRKSINQKGLEVGLPSIILFDINAIAVSLSSMRNLLMSEQLKERWSSEDADIAKKLRIGNEIPAFFDKERQVNELRSSIYKLDSFLFDLVNRLNRLQMRLQGKEISDLEHKG